MVGSEQLPIQPLLFQLHLSTIDGTVHMQDGTTTILHNMSRIDFFEP